MPSSPKLIMQFKVISTNSGFLFFGRNQHSYSNFLLPPASCAVSCTTPETTPENSSRKTEDAPITISSPSHPANHAGGRGGGCLFIFSFLSMWPIEVVLVPDIRVTSESYKVY